MKNVAFALIATLLVGSNAFATDTILCGNKDMSIKMKIHSSLLSNTLVGSGTTAILAVKDNMANDIGTYTASAQSHGGIIAGLNSANGVSFFSGGKKLVNVKAVSLYEIVVTGEIHGRLACRR